MLPKHTNQSVAGGFSPFNGAQTLPEGTSEDPVGYDRRQACWCQSITAAGSGVCECNTWPLQGQLLQTLSLTYL